MFLFQGWQHVNLFPLASTEVVMRRLEGAKAFEEEDRQIAALELAKSPQAQLVKQRSDETGESIYKVALDVAKEHNESINADSTVDDRVAA